MSETIKSIVYGYASLPMQLEPNDSSTVTVVVAILSIVFILGLGIIQWQLIPGLLLSMPKGQPEEETDRSR